MTIDEEDLRRAWEASDYRTVTTLAIMRYGKGIHSVMADRLRSEADAWDVFSLFAEALWRGLPGFQWRSTLRAWAYRIARNATVRWAMASERKPGRNLPMEGSVAEAIVRLRSSTLVHFKTEVKTEIRRLREELPEPDQVLLILRVDKELEWDEVATALVDDDLPADELRRESARLRKRFQEVIKKLRKLAHERGILDR